MEAIREYLAALNQSGRADDDGFRLAPIKDEDRKRCQEPLLAPTHKFDSERGASDLRTRVRAGRSIRAPQLATVHSGNGLTDTFTSSAFVAVPVQRNHAALPSDVKRDNRVSSRLRPP